MAFWRRFLVRSDAERLGACTALDIGTEFANPLVVVVSANDPSEPVAAWVDAMGELPTARVSPTIPCTGRPLPSTSRAATCMCPLTGA